MYMLCSPVKKYVWLLAQDEYPGGVRYTTAKHFAIVGKYGDEALKAGKFEYIVFIIIFSISPITLYLLKS